MRHEAVLQKLVVLFMDCYRLGRQTTATKREMRANRETCQEEGYVGQEVRNPTEADLGSFTEVVLVDPRFPSKATSNPQQVWGVP